MLFTNLKKRYLKKRNELKLSKKSGTSAEAVLKAEKTFKPYQFLVWLDDFIQLRKGKTIRLRLRKRSTSRRYSSSTSSILFCDLFKASTDYRELSLTPRLLAPERLPALNSH